MNKLLAIVGPTATGKTSLGVGLARKLGGEIISADSRQVYQGMDVITGKDLPEKSKLKVENLKLGITDKRFTVGYYQFENVPVWLLDLIRPDQKFSVADYYRLAWPVVKDLWGRGKLPIVVGGTGFYLRALLTKFETMDLKPDWILRQELASCSVASLASTLKKIDAQKWQTMNESDRKNPRRLIRAIEVAKSRQSLIINPPADEVGCQPPEADSLVVGLRAPYDSLYERIDKRVVERVENGAEAEVKRLLSRGYDWRNSVMGTTIGYQQWQEYFEGKKSREEVVKEWQFAEHGYARRQMTWFRKELCRLNGQWVEIDKPRWQLEVEKLVHTWYI